MRLGVVPLDDRPSCFRVPQLLARLAGADLVMPPAEAVGGLTRQADTHALTVWLRDVARDVDGLVVSLDQLTAGSAVGPADPLAAVAALSALRDVRAAAPDAQILGYLVGDRPFAPPSVPQADRWMSLVARRLSGDDVGDDLAMVEHDLDAATRKGVAQRRMAAHAAALASLGLAADGTVDLLLLGMGAVPPGGIAAQERAWLAGWVRPLDLTQQVPLQPGAGELGGVLLARLLNSRRDTPPRVGFYCPVPDAEKRPAPGEEGSVSRTVVRQLRALGAELVESDADVVLALHPPAVDEPPLRSDPERAAADLADELVRLHTIGVPAALVDVADRVNGVLIDRLRSRVDLARLAAYAGGGPAGDAVGAAMAHACAWLQRGDEDTSSVHGELLVRRFVDGWAYKTKAVQRARRRLARDGDEPPPLAAIEAEIERDLSNALGHLPSFSQRFRIVPGSVHLPWQRIDECEFAVERVDVPVAARRT